MWTLIQKEKFLLWDIILGAKSESKLMEVKKVLSKTFEMKDLGPLHHFPGVKIIQDSVTGTIWIGQQSYIY